jgi:hypothetical protein
MQEGSNGWILFKLSGAKSYLSMAKDFVRNNEISDMRNTIQKTIMELTNILNNSEEVFNMVNENENRVKDI